MIHVIYGYKAISSILIALWVPGLHIFFSVFSKFEYPVVLLQLFAFIQFVTFFYYLGYVFTWVCVSVRLFVCEQDNSKSYRRILMKFSGYVLNRTRNKWLDFGSDLDHCLDPWKINWEWSGSLSAKIWNRGGKAISVLIVGFESSGIELPWWRSVLSEGSCYLCVGYTMSRAPTFLILKE